VIALGEVTKHYSVGSVAFQEKCLRKMEEFRARGVTIVLVSHALPLVEHLCDTAALLDKGKLVEVAARGRREEKGTGTFWAKPPSGLSGKTYLSPFPHRRTALEA